LWEAKKARNLIMMKKDWDLTTRMKRSDCVKEGQLLDIIF
jgi:hypothetical protein